MLSSSLAEAVIDLRDAVSSSNWQGLEAVIERHREVFRFPLVADEVDRLRCEIQNFEV